MTDEQVWDSMMSDDEFVSLSLPYFKKKYWTLHEGCCLVAKVNPLEHPGVGVGFEDWTEDDEASDYDYTRRPFQVAIRSIKAHSEAELFDYEKPKLSAFRVDDPLLDGNSVILDVTVFVSWVLNRWPHQTDHFELAWALRQDRKAASIDNQLSALDQHKSISKDDKRFEAFVQLKKELDAKFNKTSDRRLAELLAESIKGENHQAKPETLRKKIKAWHGKLSG